MSKVSIKRNRGLQTLFVESRHILHHPDTVSFFLGDGVVRVTPRNGEWDSEDLISHFLLAGYPKQYELEEDNPYYPQVLPILDSDVYQVIWWDDDEQRSAVIAKNLWESIKNED